MKELKVMEDVGFTKNESVVYFALLRNGVLTSGEILKKSGINSGKIYEILERLQDKGVVSETTINNVRHFAAAPPSQILKYIRNKQDELKKDEKDIVALLPQLQKMMNISKQQALVRVYTGYRGIETAMDQLLSGMKPDEEILGMGSTKFIHGRTKRFWNRYTRIRVGKKIRTRMLFSERTDYYKDYKKTRYSKSRFLNTITPVTVYVYGKDNTLIFNYEDPPSCILINDKGTADSFRNFFEQLWLIAKK